MSGAGLRFRLTRSDGVVLYEGRVEHDDEVAAIATSHADQAVAARAAGFGWTLDVLDEEGDLFPAGEWQNIDSEAPPAPLQL